MRIPMWVTAVAVAGCVKTSVIDGVVVDGRGPAVGLQQPVRGATITVTCPTVSGLPPPAESDASGHVKLTLGKRFARDCVVDVAMAGYEPAHVVVGDVCPPHEAEPGAAYCGLETVIVVRLNATDAPPAVAPE